MRGRTGGGPTLPALSDRPAPGAGDRTVGSRSPAASTRGTGTRSPVRSRRLCKPRVHTAPIAGFPDCASPGRACGWRLPSGAPALAGDPVRQRLLDDLLPRHTGFRRPCGARRGRPGAALLAAYAARSALRGNRTLRPEAGRPLNPARPPESRGARTARELPLPIMSLASSGSAAFSTSWRVPWPT